MRAQGGGRIVNFSDWVAKSGRPRYRGLLPYYVAKAGVIALTEALALELAPDHILVNAVAPGPIVAPPELKDDEVKAVEDATPLGRWGREDRPGVARLGLHHRRDRQSRRRTTHPLIAQRVSERSRRAREWR
jgi:NAD(P)-dependent dehydrogenase (short-subunit alcohol dehydrogenase family)